MNYAERAHKWADELNKMCEGDSTGPGLSSRDPRPGTEEQFYKRVSEILDTLIKEGDKDVCIKTLRTIYFEYGINIQPKMVRETLDHTHRLIGGEVLDRKELKSYGPPKIGNKK